MSRRLPAMDRRRGAVLFPAAALAFILVGTTLRFLPGLERWGHLTLEAGLILVGAPVVLGTLRGALRGKFAADLVASLAVLAAVLLNEPLAGLVVVLMQTGGESLERYAEGRASRAVRELEEAAPRHAHRVRDGALEDVPADAVAVGDLLLVRPGELVPCDGVVVDGRSHVDASRLTGEPMGVPTEAGAHLLSGSVNGEGSLRLRATALARESQYARIVELVRTAQESKSPLQRLADRYAVWFTPITLLFCGLVLLLTHDPVRVLAVLVIATPCPLILATPVAIIGGINRAARRQVIVRNGGALEQLAGATIVVFDKTGTLTIGQPQVSGLDPAPGFSADELLRLAATAEQASSHLLARTVVAAAEARGIRPGAGLHVTESPGRGVEGDVAGRRVAVGSLGYIALLAPDAVPTLTALGETWTGLRAYVAVDGGAAGMIRFADRLRPGTAEVFADLRRLGIRRTVLLSGDHASHTRAIADELGIEDARGELLPEDKVAAIRDLRRGHDGVVMVGDGTNDAPALSTADVGIALAGHGGGITTEAAEIVILVDELDRVVEALRTSRRTLRIARQSIWVGLGLSAVGMVFAAFGMIPPTVGALAQEAIDVAVILNALRASGGGRQAAG